MYKRKRVIWSQSVGDKSVLIINSGVDKVITTKVRYSYAKDTLAAERSRWIQQKRSIVQ